MENVAANRVLEVEQSNGVMKFIPDQPLLSVDLRTLTRNWL